MENVRLGNRLKVARAEGNLSQEELAGLVGVTRVTVSASETGRDWPSALLAFLLSKQLDKPVEELFFWMEILRMNNRSDIRDERAIAVENASYRWGYLLLAFGLLAIVAFRGLVLQETNWDLLALVIVSGFATTVYQGAQQVLSRRWLLITLATALLAAVIAAAIALLR